MRRTFRERDPVRTGIVALTLMALAFVAALNIERLPLIGTGDTYHAAFSEASGLMPRAEVRIAGVKVGTVTKVDLDGAHVRVDFRVHGGTRLGSRTRAAIKIKNVFGAKYLALDPEGGGRLAPGSTIPLSRTRPLYDVLEALGDLGDTLSGVDAKRLAGAFDTLAATFKDSPPEVKASLRGLSRLSKTVSSRDARLHELLRRSTRTSEVLAERDADLTRLLADGDALLREVQRRREVIHRLLVDTVRLSRQLTALVRDNQARLEPALARLHDVVRVLRRNQRNLDRGIDLVRGYFTEVSDVLGNGRWVDVYIQNLLLVPPSVPATLPVRGAAHTTWSTRSEPSTTPEPLLTPVAGPAAASLLLAPYASPLPRPPGHEHQPRSEAGPAPWAEALRG